MSIYKITVVDSKGVNGPHHNTRFFNGKEYSYYRDAIAAHYESLEHDSEVTIKLYRITLSEAIFVKSETIKTCSIEFFADYDKVLEYMGEKSCM